MGHSKQEKIDRLKARIVWLGVAKVNIRNAIRCINKAVLNKKELREAAKDGVIDELEAAIGTSSYGDIGELYAMLNDEINELKK